MCDGCYWRWSDSREKAARARLDRDNHAWNAYRATAKEFGIEQATAEIPDEFRHDPTWMGQKRLWDMWWEGELMKAKKKANAKAASKGVL